MKRTVLILMGTAAFAVAGAAPAQSYESPCTTQQALFEKYKIEFNMDAPLVAEAYNTACDTAGGSQSQRAAAAQGPDVERIIDELIVCVREPCP
jgi:hypothetical protein